MGLNQRQILNGIYLQTPPPKRLGSQPFGCQLGPQLVGRDKRTLGALQQQSLEGIDILLSRDI